MTERCSGCGLVIAGGDAGCQAIMDGLALREMGDARFGGAMRLRVDAYCLQHPARYCVSGKSLAAHLMGLGWILDHRGDPRHGSEALRRWLDGAVPIDKPALPEFRGRLTIADVAASAEPLAYRRALEAWGHAVWAAYFGLHGLAEAWIAAALAERRAPRHR